MQSGGCLRHAAATQPTWRLAHPAPAIPATCVQHARQRADAAPLSLRQPWPGPPLHAAAPRPGQRHAVVRHLQVPRGAVLWEYGQCPCFRWLLPDCLLSLPTSSRLQHACAAAAVLTCPLSYAIRSIDSNQGDGTVNCDPNAKMTEGCACAAEEAGWQLSQPCALLLHILPCTALVRQPNQTACLFLVPLPLAASRSGRTWTS